MEASSKIALLRQSEVEIFTSRAEINVIVYEPYKAFYAENPPLYEDISHCGLDPANLFAEQKDQLGHYSPEDLAIEVPPVGLDAHLHLLIPARICPFAGVVQQPPSPLAGEALGTSSLQGFWSPGVPSYNNGVALPHGCSLRPGRGAGLQHLGLLQNPLFRGKTRLQGGTELGLGCTRSRAR